VRSTPGQRLHDNGVVGRGGEARLVPHEGMVQAVASDGVGFNLARALGGFVMATAGSATTVARHYSVL
jgi:hypothetical protein